MYAGGLGSSNFALLGLNLLIPLFCWLTVFVTRRFSHEIALDDGNSIVTTNILRDKLGLEIGGILTLQLENIAVDYKITGFLDTNRSIGHVGYISSYLKSI